MRKASKALLYTLSENIKIQRKLLGLSQEKLADKCGLHRTYIGAIERGERNVTLSSLEAVAAALSLAPHQLLVSNYKECSDESSV